MRGRTVNTHVALAIAQIGNQTVALYVGKMRGITEQMFATGRPLDDDELVAYILTGLDANFNPFVSSFITEIELISIKEMCAQLVICMRIIWCSKQDLVGPLLT
jgi:hypothetical protein